MIATLQTDDLHGNVPDSSGTALLLVDVINDLNFPRNASLIEKAPLLGKNISRLKSRCRKAGIPCIYVNDNRDQWRSDFRYVVEQCLKKRSPGRHFVKQLLPAKDDYVVLKPKHSAFYATPLETILAYMRVRDIILAGIATDSCILGTAMELHVRDFKTFVPSDCTYALSEPEHERALLVIKSSFDGEIGPSTDLILRKGKVKLRAQNGS